MNTAITYDYSKMDILGVPQLKKEYKTPEYVRAAQKRAYERRKSKTVSDDSSKSEDRLHAKGEKIRGETNTKATRNHSEDCKKHRLKKKLDRLATNLDVEYLQSILDKLGNQNTDDLQQLVNNLRVLLGKKVDNKPLLEVYLAGSKVQPTSVINVMVYHLLRDKFTSLTQATQVLGMNYRTLTVNHDKLLEVLQLAKNYKYSVSILDESGQLIKSSYLSDDNLNKVLDALP